MLALDQHTKLYTAPATDLRRRHSGARPWHAPAAVALCHHTCHMWASHRCACQPRVPAIFVGALDAVARPCNGVQGRQPVTAGDPVAVVGHCIVWSSAVSTIQLAWSRCAATGSDEGRHQGCKQGAHVMLGRCTADAHRQCGRPLLTGVKVCTTSAHGCAATSAQRRPQLLKGASRAVCLGTLTC